MKFNTYEDVVIELKKDGYKILSKSNGLNWVYMYKVDQVMKTVSLVAWYQSSGEIQYISNIEDYLLMDILDEMGYKSSISL